MIVILTIWIKYFTFEAFFAYMQTGINMLNDRDAKKKKKPQHHQQQHTYPNVLHSVVQPPE